MALDAAKSPFATCWNPYATYGWLPTRKYRKTGRAYFEKGVSLVCDTCESKKNWSLPVGVESIILCLPVHMFYYPKLVEAEAIIKQAISEFPRASVSKRG